jgi:excisionase family DNA binding protein
MIIVQLDSEQLSNLIESAVRKAIIETPQSEQPEADKLLTIKEAGEFLHLSIPTLYGYVSRNEIPFSKPPHSKRLWFSKQELIEWVKSGRKKTISEINAEANTYLTAKKK